MARDCTHAFILSGGAGTRLRPITLEIAKTLLPVKGKPIVSWNIELCRRHGVKNVVLGTGYLGKQMEQQLGSGRALGVRLGFSREKTFLGTAGALKQAEGKIKGPRFVMMNGDEVKDVDLTKLMRVHEKLNALATIALVEVEDVSSYGIVEFDGHRVVSFREKDPSNHQRGFISAGAYVLSREIFDRIPKKTAFSIEKDVFVPLASEGKLACAKTVSSWFATDSFDKYARAIEGWKGFSKNSARPKGK